MHRNFASNDRLCQMAFAPRNYEHELTKKMVVMNGSSRHFKNVREFLLDDKMRTAIEQINIDANLREAICHDMNDIIMYAVYQDDKDLDHEKGHVLSNKATTCLQRSVKGLDEDGKNKLFNQLLNKFITEIDYYRDHHVFAGHIQTLIMHMIEQEDAVLQPFANNKWVQLLNCILANIDQLSCRTFLAKLVNVRALEGRKLEIFRHIGQVLYTFATEKKKDHLFGTFWALRTANAELIDPLVATSYPDELKVFAKDVQFMSNLVYSVFMYPSDYYLAYLEGLQLLSECVEYCEKELVSPKPLRFTHNKKNPVSRMIKQFAKSWYEEWKIGEIDWSEKSEKLELKRDKDNKPWIMVAAFPVLWHYAIDYMYPLFFWDRVNEHPMLGNLTRAFYQRVNEMSVARLIKFVSDHDIIRLIVESKQYYPADEVIQNAEDETPPCLNPSVPALARVIALKREGLARPHCLYLDRKLENEFAEFLARTAMPDRSMLRYNSAAPPKEE